MIPEKAAVFKRWL